MKVLCGPASEILKSLPENSIDTVYTTPSPFGYYENQPFKIGGETSLMEYIENLLKIISDCHRVLKKTGSLFIQLGDQFTPQGDLAGIPVLFEMRMRDKMLLNDRLFWHRTEKTPLKDYKDKGFLKNYEYIWHYIKSPEFYFNENSKYARTSIHSYPLEDSYYTNEFDSGLPEQLTRMVIDTTVPENGVILDPLAGSGKVGVVAKKMNRDFIGIDIDFDTCHRMAIRLELKLVKDPNRTIYSD